MLPGFQFRDQRQRLFARVSCVGSKPLGSRVHAQVGRGFRLGGIAHRARRAVFIQSLAAPTIAYPGSRHDLAFVQMDQTFSSVAVLFYALFDKVAKVIDITRMMKREVGKIGFHDLQCAVNGNASIKSLQAHASLSINHRCFFSQAIQKNSD